MSQAPTRILLIDDDQEDYQLIREQFADITTGRFSVDWQPDFEKARQQIQSQVHDVYLIDYRLGEKTGLDLFSEMKTLGYKKPMIVLTGYADKQVDEAAMHAGAADYLVKAQVTPHLLERSVRYAIHRAEMESHILVQDRLASIGLLASGLAHDIGTPLGVVRGRAEYLSMQLKDQPQHKKNLDIMISEIDRVSNLIKSVLGFAKGEFSDHLGYMTLHEAVSTILGLLQHEFQKRDIRIENHVSADKPIKVKGQAEKFQQVLMNLLINSVHAIDVAIKQGRPAGHLIELTAQERGAMGVLSIRDSGCGISQRDMKNLFKPFFTTKEAGRGTGLGLVMAGWLVQLWGGTIEVESEENVGTRFEIHLQKVQNS